MFELTRSYLGIQEQNNMLLAAANLHSNLEKDPSKIIGLSSSQRKSFIRNGMVSQIKELGRTTSFVKKHMVLYRMYQLYEDFYFYFVDRFKQYLNDVSMGEVHLSMLVLADKYLEHELNDKGYANIFNFLERDKYSNDLLDDYSLGMSIENNKKEQVTESTKYSFDFNDVSDFFNWEGRPAVTVEPSDGLLEGWFIRTSSDPGEWEMISPLEIRDSGRVLSSEDFYEVFADYLNTNTSSSEGRKYSRPSWMDKASQALDVTQEEWQEIINARYADEVDKHQKMSEPKIMQIECDFNWDDVYGFCNWKGAPALQFTTENDPNDKTLTPYAIHARYLDISKGAPYWKEIYNMPIGVCAHQNPMSKDEFIKFANDYINKNSNN